jgi:hypothetical protein
MEAGLDLPFEFAFAPALVDGQAHVEFVLLGAFTLAQNDQVVGPRQLSHQR